MGEDAGEPQGELNELMAEEEPAAMDDIIIPGGKIDAGPQVKPQQPAGDTNQAEPDAAEMEELEA